MNKIKYYILGQDSVIGTVYEHEKYGRTLVTSGVIGVYENVRVIDARNKPLLDTDMMDFLLSMIPTEQGE